MGWILIIGSGISFACIIVFCISSTDTSGQLFSKRLYKRVKAIEEAISCSKKDCLSITCKGQRFSIQVKDAKVNPGIKYSTIPAYTCKDICINDELVCKVHRLERLFTSSYAAEVSCKRNEFELVELLSLAYKKAKKINKDRKSVV